MTKFFEMRGELAVSTTKWSEPVGEEVKYDNQTVLRTKHIKMKV